MVYLNGLRDWNLLDSDFSLSPGSWNILHSLPSAFSDDLPDGSHDQPRVQGTFLGEDMRVQGPDEPVMIHPEEGERHAVDSRKPPVQEWIGPKLTEKENLHAGEEGLITPSFLIPQQVSPRDPQGTTLPIISPKGLQSDTHDHPPLLYPPPGSSPVNKTEDGWEEDFPAAPIPTQPLVPKSVVDLSVPSRAPVKPTGPTKLDGLLKLTTRGDSTGDLYENKPENEELADPVDLGSPPLKPDSQDETPPRKHVKGFLRPTSEEPPRFSALKRDTLSPSSLSTGINPSFRNKNGSSPSADNPSVAALMKTTSSSTANFRRKLLFAVPASKSREDHPATPKGLPEGKLPRRRNAMIMPRIESRTRLAFKSAALKSAASPSTFGSNIYAADSTFAREKIEEAGRLRRLQSQSLETNPTAVNNSPTTPTVSYSQKPAKASSDGILSPPGHAPSAPLKNVSNTLRHETRDAKAHPGIHKTPVRALPIVPPINNDAISHAAELQALRDQLNCAMLEVKALKNELTLLTIKSDNDRECLVGELKIAKQDNVILVNQTKLLTQRNERAQADLRKFTEEKRDWQEQLDTMHHKVVQADRQIRRLDHLTRGKLEVREETIFGSTRGTKLAMTQKQPSSEVIKAFEDLNEEIVQAANLLVENLDRTHCLAPTTEMSSRAERVLGTHVTQMLNARAGSETVGFDQLLMVVVLEIFFVHWCSAIIEGFYPKRTTFADLLVELSFQPHALATTAGGCRKQLQVVETQSSAAIATQYPIWASEIIRDLSDILLIGGLKIWSQRQGVFTSKIQSIIAIAYDLRAALAENHICGGFELVVESPDSPFQPKWMLEEYTMERTSNATMLTQMEPIAGTTGVGLKRTNVGDTQDDVQTYLLKPKVVLVRILRENI